MVFAKSNIKLIRTAVYVFVCLLMIVLSYTIINYTKGLIVKDVSSDNIYVLSESDGSIADQNETIEFGIYAFAVPLLFRIVRFKKQIDISDYFVLIVVIFLQFCYLSTVPGKILYDTVFYGGNITIVLWFCLIVATFISALFLIILAMMSKKQANR